MRITSEAMVARSLERLNSRLASYERKQTELSTGKRIIAASDDPAGARRAMSLRGSIRAREQELSNISDARGWLDSADSQLQAATDRLSRARELATRAASVTNVNERTAIASELRAIGGELEGIANATHLGRPLFGGFTGGKAVEKDGGGVWQTNGGGDRVERRVSDSELVRVNVTAEEWLGFGTADGDLLTQLEQLADDVLAGDPAVIGASLDRLERAGGTISDSLSIIGASTNRIDSAHARITDLLLTQRTELSEVESIDIAQGVMELQVQQVAYEATLQALGKALPPSLVAFLR